MFIYMYKYNVFKIWNKDQLYFWQLSISKCCQLFKDLCFLKGYLYKVVKFGRSKTAEKHAF